MVVKLENAWEELAKSSSLGPPPGVLIQKIWGGGG